MRVLPTLIFAAAAGLGSNVMFFKHTSQLNYDNAVLTLRVHQLERRLAALREERADGEIIAENASYARSSRRSPTSNPVR